MELLLHAHVALRNPSLVPQEVWERVLAHLLRQPMLEGYEQDAATGESTVDATVSLPIYKHFLLEKSLCCKASSSCGVLQF